MKNYHISTFVSIIVIIASFNEVSHACGTTPLPETTPEPQNLVGGVSSMTKEDMRDPMFQDSLGAVLKQLDDANKCHSFELIRVISATKQIVAGVKYTMRIEVKPIYSEESDDDCTDEKYTSVSGNKICDVSVVTQVWQPTKYSIKFEQNRDFTADGSLRLPIEMNKWRTMSSSELQSPVFSKAVQDSILQLNAESHKCIRFELVDVLNGKQRLSSVLEYKWEMRVNKIYDYKIQECMGICADDCSGTGIYSGKAVVSPPNSGTPQVTDVRFVKSEGITFADQDSDLANL